MDLQKRKADLLQAEKQALAQLNAIAGQLQLVNELLAEQEGKPAPEPDGEETPPPEDAPAKLDS